MKLVDCPTHRIEWPDGVHGMDVVAGGRLVVSCFREFLVCDLHDPRDLKILHRHKARFGRTTRTRVRGTELVLFSDGGVEIVDLAGEPKTTRAWELDEVERSGDFHGDDLYVSTETGVGVLRRGAKKLEELIDLGSDATNLRVEGDLLYVTTRDDRLVILRRETKGLELVHTVKKGYTPEHLTWWKPGLLLLVGNEDVIGVDVATPEWAKQLKSCKLRGWILAPAMARDGDRAFVAGTLKKKPGRFGVATVDLSRPPIATIASKAELRVDERTDDITGIVLAGKHLLVSGYYLEIKVVEI